MHENKLFRPLSKLSSHHDHGSFEVPGENYTALSLVTVALLLFAIIHLPLGLFSLLLNAIKIDLHDRKLIQEVSDSSAYPKARHVAGFIVSIGILVVLFSSLFSINTLIRLKSELRRTIVSGMTSLDSGIVFVKNAQTDKAIQEFLKSEELFIDAQNSLQKVDSLTLALLRITPILGTKITDAENSIRAGLDCLKSAQIAIKAYQHMLLTQSNESDYVSLLKTTRDALTAISPLIEDAKESLDAIQYGSISLEYRNTFDSAKSEITNASNTIPLAIQAIDAVSDSIGSNTLRRYLLLFQNNAELRPTGGFIGSFALVDMVDGKMRHIEIPPGGPYDLRGSFHERLNPPEPLRLVASEWNFQDANWWADFPTSAQKILWFYEKSGGPTVDGVIAVNASLIPHLLELTGPITLSNYNKQLSPDSALHEIQKSVELEYDKTINKPKQIIADLFPMLMESLSKSQSISTPQLISLIISSLKNKEIQVYFSNARYQELADKLNISGAMKQFEPDYSMIVSSNIGGGKSDAVISTDVSHTIAINADGSINATFTLQRKHKGTKGDLFNGMQHNDYIRFYAPIGSSVLTAEGFSEAPEEAKKPLLAYHHDDETLLSLQTNIRHDQFLALDQWNERGREVFGGWLFTKPSSQSNLTITYRLPFTISDLKLHNRSAYALLIQKQSGTTISSYTFNVMIPSANSLTWKYGGTFDEIKNTNTAAYQTSNFQSDHYIGFGFK